LNFAQVLEKWMELVEGEFPGKSVDTSKKAIAVHCVAGLGRAPVLVCIALVEVRDRSLV
jgi:protein tyrosine phosphatase type 4A